jgi:hypothetical protein
VQALDLQRRRQAHVILGVGDLDAQSSSEASEKSAAVVRRLDCEPLEVGWSVAHITLPSEPV